MLCKAHEEAVFSARTADLFSIGAGTGIFVNGR